LNQHFDGAGAMPGFGETIAAEFDEADEGVQKMV
jgi:hypothetical protein